jgi:hypothetical protein
MPRPDAAFSDRRDRFAGHRREGSKGQQHAGESASAHERRVDDSAINGALTRLVELTLFIFSAHFMHTDQRK